MKEKIKQLINSKQFHICILVLIIFLILFLVGIISLKYNVVGEANLPFDLSKIVVISNCEGIDDTNDYFNIITNQNNDIYLYIKKNDKHKETEIIDNIRLDNFQIKEAPKIGTLKLLKPDEDISTSMFRNISSNEVDKIEYTGDIDSSIKGMRISNQGGLVVFRYANENIGTYASKDNQEKINHDELLKKIGINNDDLKFKVGFDMYINLKSRKSYKAYIELELPINDVVNNGRQSIEYTDLKNVVFKRV